MNNYLIKDLMNVNRGSSPRPIIEYLSDSGYRWLKILDKYHFGGILADDMGLRKNNTNVICNSRLFKK